MQGGGFRQRFVCRIEFGDGITVMIETVSNRGADFIGGWPLFEKARDQFAQTGHPILIITGQCGQSFMQCRTPRPHLNKMVELRFAPTPYRSQQRLGLGIGCCQFAVDGTKTQRRFKHVTHLGGIRFGLIRTRGLELAADAGNFQPFWEKPRLLSGLPFLVEHVQDQERGFLVRHNLPAVPANQCVHEPVLSIGQILPPIPATQLVANCSPTGAGASRLSTKATR